MYDDAKIALLLDTWEDSQMHGEPVTVAELCRDCTDLIPELSRRIEVLRKFEALRADGGDATAEFCSARADTDLGSGATAGTAVPQPPAVGDDFGGYRIVALLGEGGMGRVYRAVDSVLRREVALKIVKPESAAHSAARERFLREARALAAVEHDHVAPIFQVGEVNGLPFLAMPLLKGETLADRLARDKILPAAEVLRIGREAAAGLAAAHARGLIHRDVKPSNIWLESAATASGADAATNRVKLLDFGLAREQKPVESVTAEGRLLGTPAYMSPEQADGQPLDHRSDLFGLGTVLYECSTGQRPFHGKTLTALLTAIAQRPCPAPHEIAPTVPVELSKFILRLLAKSPAERPQSALAVVEALRAIETGVETAAYAMQLSNTAPERSLKQHLAKRSRRFAVGCSVSVTIAALLLVAVCYVALHQRDANENFQARVTVPPPPNQVELNHPPGIAVGPGETHDDDGPRRLNAKLDLRVWKQQETSKPLKISAAGALPLQAGDYIRIEAQTDRPAYLYVIYLDASGEAAPWYPWQNFNWDERRPEKKQSRLNFPEDLLKGEWRLTAGPSGIEAVLLLARDEPLSADEAGRLRHLFDQKPPPAKFDPLLAVVWLGPDDRFGNVRDRGRPNLDPTGTVVDPVERIRRLVRGDLKNLAGDVRGVCYPFQGK